MLTDYHVHLRPDADQAPPEEGAFTAENVDRYVAAAEKAGIQELGVSEHVYRFTQALEVWQHPFWQEEARDDLDAYEQFVHTTPLRLGIEMDYVAGREDRIANLLESHEFDYVIGSVHFVHDKAVDYDVWDIWESMGDADQVWKLYFDTLAGAALSGLFDVLAHPDLVKIWGGGRPMPERDPRFYYEPAVQAIEESGIAVEVSTAGLRKPVREIYPAPAFAAMCVDAGAAFSLSSDAHVPEDIGYAYEQALDEMRGWGVGEIAVFDGRRRRLEPLGPGDAKAKGGQIR
jgi:histidinol-phosphatase (PHP family)